MMNTYRLSRHAQRRRKLMRVTEAQILGALYSPDTIYPSHDDRTCYQRAELVIVVQNETQEVVTVLWHRAEGRDEEGHPL
jgi:hypothetical protein